MSTSGCLLLNVFLRAPHQLHGTKIYYTIVELLSCVDIFLFVRFTDAVWTRLTLNLSSISSRLAAPTSVASCSSASSRPSRCLEHDTQKYKTAEKRFGADSSCCLRRLFVHPHCRTPEKCRAAYKPTVSRDLTSSALHARARRVSARRTAPSLDVTTSAVMPTAGRLA